MPLRKALVVAVCAVLPLAVAAPRASAMEPSVEAQVVAQINAARSETLIVHSGLLAAAREHSRHMAMDGSLGHEGADARVNNAPPDPAEADGAPDNGFPVAAWCENVTYTVGTSESEAPKRIYAQWERSGAHQRCMMDTSRNVGAVGVYYDGQSWWATFIAEVDNSPPGGGTRPQPQPADAKPTPEPRVTPQATPDAEARPDDTSTASAPPATPAGLVDSTAEPDARAEPVSSPPDEASPSREEPSDLPAGDPIDAEPGRQTTRAAAPFAGTARSGTDPVAPPLAIGWQELLGVTGVLSVATFVLRGRVRPAVQSKRPPSHLPLTDREPVGAGSARV